jgi:hypothetical protein
MSKQTQYHAEKGADPIKLTSFHREFSERDILLPHLRVEEQFGGRIRAVKEMEHMSTGKLLEARAHVNEVPAPPPADPLEPKKSVNYRF